MCWKYKLLKPLCKPYHFPICCVGCKWGRNMICTKGGKRTPNEKNDFKELEYDKEILLV